MELHNIIEDIVMARVADIFQTIEKDGNQEKLCTCEQCMIDTACYVLNRSVPHYIVSNRGAARVHHENIEQQQRLADITAMIYEGLKRVNHNQRPNFNHDSTAKADETFSDKPVYNIPAITGRLFDGGNFAPLSGATIELILNGVTVAMKDGNWQNPLHLDSHTEGTFIFWPIPIKTEVVREHTSFEFVLKVEAPEYEALNHVFSIPVISEYQTTRTFTLDRTFKLPDLFMFPPGEAEEDSFLD